MTGHPVFLGFDPGGEHNFGVAVIVGADVRTITVSTVAEAMAWAVARCGDRIPAAAGIDTLLHWSDGAAGWRPADKLLRAAYPTMANSVMSPNGLFGSMGIGGMALALRLRERWPGILLNETHPKVLVGARGGPRYQDAAADAAIEWFAAHSGLDMRGARGGHELDGVLSAWTTREGLSKGWGDLVGVDRSLIFPAGAVSYLWPEVLVAKFPTSTLPVVRKPPVAANTSSRRVSRGTTTVGHVTNNQQEVLRATGLPGTDHGQSIYVLRCKACGYEYGANGSDIWVRKCPKHDGGKPGLPYDTENDPR